MKAIVVVFVLLLPACSTLPPTVDIPVAVPCTSPPVAVRPKLSISRLTDQTPPAEVLRTYQESLEQLGGYAEQLEDLLDGYRGEIP